MSKDPDQNIVDKITNALEPRFLELKQGQEEGRKEQNKQGKILTKQSKTLDYVKKSLDVAIGIFNTEDVELWKRVERIEKHLGLSKLQ